MINKLFCFIGTVLASRLSENKDYNVLLLEAGGDENAFTEVPMFSTQVQNTEKYMWKFYMEPQANAFRGK